MRKLSLLLLLSVFAFWGCNNDDDPKNEVVVSFENQLSEPESEYISKGTPNAQGFQKETFKDPMNLATFEHSYADWGYGYSFASITYTNKTDNTVENSPASIAGKGKTGKVYLAVNSSEGEYGNSAFISINNSDQYAFKGTWVSNSTYAYTAMTKGYGQANPFKKGSWFKVTAIGYNSESKEIGKAEILLANYQADTDLPEKNWIWFDLTPLKDAVKINFIPSSTDNDPQWGMNTPAYFCLDGITLIEK